MTTFSAGGQSVVFSLSHVGLAVADLPRGVALAETATPPWPQRFEVVLAQNCWASSPYGYIAHHLRQYPTSRRLRELARRKLAQVNLREAKTVVVMSHYLGDQIRARAIADPRVVSVGTSLDLFDVAPEMPNMELPHNFILVVGSIQSYKRPEYALCEALNSQLAGQVKMVVLAGPLVDTNLLSHVMTIARERGAQVVHGEFSRPEMKWLLGNADLVVLASALESLNFTLGEALYFSKRVLASPLPVHLEVALRLRAEPHWIGQPSSQYRRASLPVAELRAAWAELARTLTQEG